MISEFSCCFISSHGGVLWIFCSSYYTLLALDVWINTCLCNKLGFDCVGVSGLVKVKVCTGVRGLCIVLVLSGNFHMKSFPAFDKIPWTHTHTQTHEIKLRKGCERRQTLIIFFEQGRDKQWLWPSYCQVLHTFVGYLIAKLFFFIILLLLTT